MTSSCGRMTVWAAAILAAALTHADDGLATSTEYTAFNPYTHRMETHIDTACEYGLMAAYVDPRFNVNNILFYTDPNDSRVWGDILALGVSGDPQAAVTWAVGGSYMWHFIDMPGIALRINELLVRASQYYQQDNRELRQVYQVFRGRLVAFVSENWGVLLRGEYMRQYASKDTSVLLGPVYVF